MPNISLNNTEYWVAPKNGGTTVRMWAKQYETGLGAELKANDRYYDLTLLYQSPEDVTRRAIPKSALR